MTGPQPSVSFARYYLSPTGSRFRLTVWMPEAEALTADGQAKMDRKFNEGVRVWLVAEGYKSGTVVEEVPK